MTESTKPSAAKRRSSSRLLASTSVFLKPYLTQIVIASVALVFTAALTLGLVQYVRLIVDRGFVEGSTESLNTAITKANIVKHRLLRGWLTFFISCANRQNQHIVLNAI